MEDRNYYKTLPPDELRRRLSAAKSRAGRATTNEDYLIDAYQIQEMSAALRELEETDTPQLYSEKMIERLARAFSENLKAVIGKEKLMAVNEKNRNGFGLASPVCASHDFCDANQVMLDVFEPATAIPARLLSDHMPLIELAWDRAKRAGFYID